MTPKQLYHKAALYCSRSEHSCMEVHDKLLTWGIDDEQLIQSILDELVEADYINEPRFSVAFTKDKFRFNRWGRKKIAYALFKKGIGGILAQEALSSIDELCYVDTLHNVLKSKEKTLKSKDKYDKYAKLMRFAVSRGFEPELVAKELRLNGFSDE